MSGRETTRPPTDLKLGNQARKALAEMQRWERRAEEAATKAASARSELADLHRKACERFGRDLPTDALLLDVLEVVEVEDGDVWRWRGRRNNYNLPTIVIPKTDRRFGERSVVRYLAVELGIIDEDENGMLFPADGDAEDVNPWHRTLRRTDVPMGNPRRFCFDLPDEREGAS